MMTRDFMTCNTSEYGWSSMIKMLLPIPGKIWKFSLVSGSTAVVTIFTFGKAKAIEWTPVKGRKRLKIKTI